MKSDNDQVNDSSTKTLCKRRWAFLFAVAALQTNCGFILASFGQVSNIFVTFYRVSVESVDWLTLVMNLVPVILALPLSWFASLNCLRFRFLILAAAFSSTAGFACLAFSVLKRSLFPLLVVGQILNSLARTAMILSPNIFAVRWFPERQIGIAVGINVMSLYLGNAIGFSVPASLLHQPSYRGNVTWANQTTSQWVTDSQEKLGGIFSLLSFTAMMCSAFLFFYVTDHPPNSQSWEEKLKNSSNAKCEHSLLQLPLADLAYLIKNKTYVTACIVFGVLFQVIAVEFIMLSEILKQNFPKIKGDRDADVIGGYVMTTYSVASMLGSLIGGEIINRCTRYKVVATLSCILAFASSTGLVLAFIFRLLSMFFACTAFFGLVSQFGVVAIFKIVTQHTYAVDEAFSSVWLIAVQGMMAVIYGEVGRCLFNELGGLAVLLLQSGSLLGSVFLSCLFASDNERFVSNKARDLHPSDVSERSALVANKK